MGEGVLSIQSSEKVTSISLPPTPPYHTVEFQLEVLCLIPSALDRPANERLTNGEVRHRPRSYSHPDTPMAAIDQRVRPERSNHLLMLSSVVCMSSDVGSSLRCPSTVPGPSTPRCCLSPSTSPSRPNTLCSPPAAGEPKDRGGGRSSRGGLIKRSRCLIRPHRKYIQVCVQNVSDVSFTLAEVKLTEKQHEALELQCLNTKTKQVSRRRTWDAAGSVWDCCSGMFEAGERCVCAASLQ